MSYSKMKSSIDLNALYGIRSHNSKYNSPIQITQLNILPNLLSWDDLLLSSVDLLLIAVVLITPKHTVLKHFLLTL